TQVDLARPFLGGISRGARDEGFRTVDQRAGNGNERVTGHSKVARRKDGGHVCARHLDHLNRVKDRSFAHFMWDVLAVGRALPAQPWSGISRLGNLSPASQATTSQATETPPRATDGAASSDVASSERAASDATGAQATGSLLVLRQMHTEEDQVS